jgi:predicted Zn-dependent protease
LAHRELIAAVFAAVLFASLPTPLYASPDVPMCVADQPQFTVAPISLVQWHAPMCGPYRNAFPVLDAQPPEARAIDAYRTAVTQVAAANYGEARLQLDLAHRGLPEISDHIALQSGRLELLRDQPTRAAEFFAEASLSPHESVRVEASYGQVLALLRADDPSADQALHDLLSTYPQVPKRSELVFEQAQSLLRQARYDEAMAAMHAVRVDHPGSRIAGWAESELIRLQAQGHETPSMTDEDRVRRARRLVGTGPLDEAKVALRDLLESPLTGDSLATRVAGKRRRPTCAPRSCFPSRASPRRDTSRPARPTWQKPRARVIRITRSGSSPACAPVASMPPFRRTGSSTCYA